MNALAWLNPGRWLAVLVFLLALWLGAQAWANHQQNIGYARAVAEYNARALVAEQAARAEEARRAKLNQEIINAANIQRDRARAELAAATRAADGLRADVAAYVRRAAPDRAAAGTSAPTQDAATSVLAELFERANQRAQALAEFADAARAAGSACERQYDALSP